MSIHVNADNFVQAETHRMFRDIQAQAGGVGTFRHNRTPARIDEQTVIRLNRDTLYSFAIVDLAEPARLTVPDADGRYLSAMIVNEDHFVNDVFHDAGEYTLTSGQYGSRYVLVGVRILVDPNDSADVAAVGAIQDRLAIDARSSQTFVMPDYDLESLDATRDALLALARGLDNFDRTFGARADVDPVRHLIGCAAGWGGLPTTEATYVGVDPNVPPGDYELVFNDVPVDTLSGRCRFTTSEDSSSPTTKTSTRSIASPVSPTLTARSLFVLLRPQTVTRRRTRSLRRKAGTTSFAYTGLAPKY